MPGIASLPMEIYDEILKRVGTCVRLDPGLMYVRNRVRIYGTLRQVNKAFYYSATRLMFETFVVRLDREVQGGHFPFIKFEELCRNANARYVQRLVIRCTDNLPSWEPDPKIPEFAVSCKQFALRLERFPSLRSVALVFFRYPFGGNGMTADSHIEQIIDALRLARLPKLESLRIHYNAQGTGDPVLESPPSNDPPISKGIKSLRNVTLYLGLSRVTKKQHSGILQILEHGESLKDVDAHGIHILPRSSSTFLHPSAPLRYLRLAFTFLPGECILELRHFKNTLTELDLDDVRLTSRSWAEFFSLLRQFSALRRQRIENCGYQKSTKYFSMKESDEQALLQYKSHRPKAWGKTTRELRPLRPSRPFW